jgi:hypothetical protein
MTENPKTHIQARNVLIKFPPGYNLEQARKTLAHWKVDEWHGGVCDGKPVLLAKRKTLISQQVARFIKLGIVFETGNFTAPCRLDKLHPAPDPTPDSQPVSPQGGNRNCETERQTIEDLRENIALMKGEIGVCEEDLAHAREDLRKTKAERDACREEIAKLNAERDACREEIAKLNAERDTLLREIEERKPKDKSPAPAPRRGPRDYSMEEIENLVDEVVDTLKGRIPTLRKVTIGPNSTSASSYKFRIYMDGVRNSKDKTILIKWDSDEALKAGAERIIKNTLEP